MRTRLLTLGLVVILPCLAGAQSPVTPPHLKLSSELDSGYRDNPGAQRVVFKHRLKLRDTAWMQLRFAEHSNLPQGSFLRLTGSKDQVIQRHDGRTLGEWQMWSAGFNGDEIVIELVAGANTRANRVKLQTVVRGLFDNTPIKESICGSSDNRALSNDKRQGRLWLGCTGWLAGTIAGGTRSLMLTAGHCRSSTKILELNVPASTSSGTVVRSHPNDQYPYTVLNYLDAGVGSDWQVASVGKNSTTNLLPTQANGGVFYTLGSVPSLPAGQNITITGYGVTNPRATRSQVQQTHTGPLAQVNATSLCYTTDTSGGNSGSPVIHANTGAVIGIHTHGGCTSTGGCNSGTRIDRADLQAAIRAAGKTLGVFTTFGSGCRGSGAGSSTCGSSNPSGGASSNNLTSNEYAYAATASANLSVVGFEVFSRSSTGGNVTVNTSIYGSAAGGVPGALLGSGTITIGSALGFYRSTVSATVPVGKFFVVVDHSAGTSLISSLTSGTAGSGYWRRPAGSGSWSSSSLLPFPAYRVLCSGGGGSGAVPAIGNVDLPMINASFSITLRAGRANASAVMLTGLSRTSWAGGSLPWSLKVIGAPGCDLLVDPLYPAGIRLNGSGFGSITLNLPNLPSIVGFSSHHQWYVVDPGNNAANIAVSNGATAKIGG